VSAYVISEVEVLDEMTAGRYRSLAQSSIAQHGGHYLVRGAVPEATEGDWPPEKRLVVVEFPSMDVLRRWYASAEYTEALSLRYQSLRRRLLFVDGVSST
jgi:uncharacterized protein (DUF1330 family)